MFISETSTALYTILCISCVRDYIALEGAIGMIIVFRSQQHFTTTINILQRLLYRLSRTSSIILCVCALQHYILYIIIIIIIISSTAGVINIHFVVKQNGRVRCDGFCVYSLVGLSFPIYISNL